MADRTRPWDDPTVPSRPTIPHNPAYRPGVAPVGQPQPGRPGGPPDPTATLTDASGVSISVPRRPLRYQVRQLKRGGEWTALGGLFAFVCWGVWAISVRSGSLIGAGLTFVLVILVAAGVFALCRLLGRMVLERSMGRIRRSAWVSHAITGVFLVATGVAYLRQTQWVVDAFSWLQGLR